MTRHSKVWAIGALALFIPFGAIVAAGVIPWANSDLEPLKDLAAVTSFLVGKHGAIFTGLFFMMIGFCLAALFLVWGDYLRRSDGGGGGALGDCGDGGD